MNRQKHDLVRYTLRRLSTHLMDHQASQHPPLEDAAVKFRYKLTNYTNQAFDFLNYTVRAPFTKATATDRFFYS